MVAGDRELAGVATAEPPLRVRLFGTFSVHEDGVEVSWLESSRGRSLFAYLMLHPGPQPRERLASLLWPDSSEHQARTNLRHLLHTLRHGYEPLHRHVEVLPQTLCWRPQVACWIDAAEFEASLRRADDPDVSVREALRLRRDALGHYTGPLLEGCYEDWALDHQARLAELRIAALTEVMLTVAALGDHGEAVRVGRELLRCDPLREDTYRLLMEVSAAAGDRAGAVRCYHECASVLRHELAVEPSARTTATLAAIMSTEQQLVSPPGPLPGSPLIGRDAEHAALVRHWREVATGSSRLVLVAGEVGVGKTRLVEEFAAWCARDGGRTAQARAYPLEGALAYGTPVAWLRSLGMGSRSAGGATARTTILDRLLSDETSGRSPAAATEVVPEAEQRLQIHDAISAALTDDHRPILLVADDAQWCDEQSLQLLHYLVRQDLGGSPVLVVFTARAEDVVPGHHVRALVDALRSIDRADEIRLHPLSRGATEQLVVELAGHRVDAATVEDLFVNSEGNPLFVVEAVNAGWADRPPDGPMLTPKLHAVVRRRLEPLSDSAAELLALAAAVGRDVSTRVLSSASPLDEVSFVRSLDELWRRGLLRERGVDGYDFSHGMIRDVVYESLGAAARRRNHRLIAAALAELHDPDLDAVSAELGRHQELCGEAEAAISSYRRAAMHAQRVFGNADAIRLLDRANELLPRVLDPSSRQQHELAILSALSTPLAVVEGFASPRLAETQQRAHELARALAVQQEPSLLRSTVMAQLCRHDFGGAVTMASRLIEAARAAGDVVLIVESQYLLGIGAFWGGEMVSARIHFEAVIESFAPDRRAEHLARFGQDPRVVCTSRLANVQFFLGTTDLARSTRQRALSEAREVGDPFSAGVTLVFAALLAVDLDEPDRFAEFVDALRDHQHQRAVATAREALFGYLDVLEGRTRAGIERIAEVMAAERVDHAPGQRATSGRLLVAAHDRAGDPRGGLAAVDRVLADPGTRLWEPEHRRLRAHFLAAVGSPSADIAAELERARRCATRDGSLGLLHRIERSRARLLGPWNG